MLQAAHAQKFKKKVDPEIILLILSHIGATFVKQVSAPQPRTGNRTVRTPGWQRNQASRHNVPLPYNDT